MGAQGWLEQLLPCPGLSLQELGLAVPRDPTLLVDQHGLGTGKGQNPGQQHIPELLWALQRAPALG